MITDNSLNILLIEDNPGDARYIEEIIKDAAELSERALDGGDGLLAGSGGGGGRDGKPTLIHESRLEAGLDRFEDADPDVVLLDLNLPDSRGLETLTTLLDRTSRVPVVVLTGLRDREMGMEALRQGAEEYLVKDEINANLLIRSVYHAIERKIHERELKRYETLIEESTDVNVIVDPDGTIQYLTPSVEHVLGYEIDELIGENCLDYIHPDDHETVRAEIDAMVETPDYRLTAEIRVQKVDGSWVVLQARGRNLVNDPMIEGLVIYTHDLTERKAYERRLEQQREQLTALNQLNEIVREVTDAVIEQSTREEIEETVCQCLAASESYLFAWIGEVDTGRQAVTLRTEAGVEGYLDDATISIDRNDPFGEGPTGRAIRTHEIQTAQDVHNDPEYEPWREHAREYGFHSSAAIPIVYEGTLYGILNVYATRPFAFTADEREVIGQLGEIIGHAIAAVERKRALMSDDVVELEFEIPNVIDSIDGSGASEGTITFEQTLPLGNDQFLIYGTATNGAGESLEAVIEQVQGWDEVSVISEDADETRFELRASEPPVISAVASVGGSIERTVIDGGDLRMTIHLPQGADVRRTIEIVQEIYPQADPLARRQVTRSKNPSQRVAHTWLDQMTDRQRTVLETAYYAGFFEWPRNSSGQEVAEKLGISPATFHEHMRAAEGKLLETLFNEKLGAVDADRSA